MLFKKTQKSRTQQRVQKYFLDEEQAMQKWQAYVKLLFIFAFSFEPLFVPDNPEDYLGRGWEVGMPLSFLPVCIAQIFVSRGRLYHPSFKYIFITIDVALFAFYIIAPSPFNFYPNEEARMLEIIGWYREEDMAELYLFFVVAVISHSRKFSIYFGFISALAWLSHLIVAASQPIAFTEDSVPLELAILPESIWSMNPRYVDESIAVEHIGFTLLMGVGIALVSYRTRLLFTRLFSSERRRASLTRYFSPNVLDRIMNNDTDDDEPLVAQTDAAILFADIRGFTQIADQLEANELLELLQSFHGRMEAIVFANNGTLEKYIGDAVMATFGAPDASINDAKAAFSCAEEMQDDIQRWNHERNILGHPVIEIGIGISYGQTVSGVIGQDRNKSFVVTGAVVTEASRLQSLTRQMDADIIVSNVFHSRLINTLSLKKDLNLFAKDSVDLKGFSKSIKVWYRRKN